MATTEGWRSSCLPDWVLFGFFFFSFHFCLFGLLGFYLLVFCSKKECNPLSLAQTHCDWQVKEAARFYFRRPSYVVSMVTRSRHIYVCCRPFYIPVIFSCFHYLSGPWAWIDVHYCASIQSAAVRFVAKLLASYVMTSLTHATRPNADADAKTKTKTKKLPSSRSTRSISIRMCGCRFQFSPDSKKKTAATNADAMNKYKARKQSTQSNKNGMGWNLVQGNRVWNP